MPECNEIVNTLSGGAVRPLDWLRRVLSEVQHGADVLYLPSTKFEDNMEG